MHIGCLLFCASSWLILFLVFFVPLCGSLSMTLKRHSQEHRRAAARLGDHLQLSAQIRRAPPHAHQTVALARPVPVEPLAVIAHLQHQPARFDLELNRGARALGVTDDVVDAFFEDFEDLSTRLRAQLDVRFPAGTLN